MYTQLYLKRLSGNRIRTCILYFLFFWPVMEIEEFLRYIPMGDRITKPDFAFFLSCESAGNAHFFQSLYFWFLPLYLVILFGEDCLEDAKTGYRNILIGKTGKKKYIQGHLVKSFLLTFIIILSGLMLNLLLVHIAFHDAVNSSMSDSFLADVSASNPFFALQVKNLLLTNITFSIIAAFIAALLASSITMLAIVFPDRRVVYPISVFVWMVLFLQEHSLTLLFQPYAEYGFEILFSIAVETVLLYTIITVVLYLWEVKIEC
ncbi:MAG: hypothetical protein Q4F21_13775 [Lachnospiraceae bacterium]|nr:hypothetical protein [Lachnospiraceae bacterium]